MELQSERDAKQLPPELWLVIMRLLNSMRDHHAMARTCQLFAALARAERERTKLRLARLSVKARTLDWYCCDSAPLHLCTVVGPFLANGQMHGRCCAYSGCTLICFEAYDDKRQGEARVWLNERMGFDEAAVRSWLNAAGRFDQDMERSWHGQPFSDGMVLRARFCYSDDKLEGMSCSYVRLEYCNWYDAPGMPWPGIERDVDCTLYYYEDGEREDYIYVLWAHDPAVRIERAERGVLQSVDRMEYGPDGLHTALYRMEDGEMQGMIVTYDDHDAILTAGYNEHGVKEGWSIAYDGHKGVESIFYCEDGRSEGAAYFWSTNPRSVKTINFRHGVRR